MEKEKQACLFVRRSVCVQVDVLARMCYTVAHTLVITPLTGRFGEAVPCVYAEPTRV
jgi:hypothetical protein